jgi:hypothetical protein
MRALRVPQLFGKSPSAPSCAAAAQFADPTIASQKATPMATARRLDEFMVGRVRAFLGSISHEKRCPKFHVIDHHHHHHAATKSRWSGWPEAGLLIFGFTMVRSTSADPSGQEEESDALKRQVQCYSALPSVGPSFLHAGAPCATAVRKESLSPKLRRCSSIC